jgi:hypothetical protein
VTANSKTGENLIASTKIDPDAAFMQEAYTFSSNLTLVAIKKVLFERIRLLSDFKTLTCTVNKLFVE